ncbi:unnamed protein product [Alternaria alternata]
MLILEDNPGVVDLLVKRYPGGKQSTHLHSLAVGEKLFVVAAIPGFSWKPNLTSHVILIAGGSGITPVFQLMQGILRNPEDKTSTTLILGSKDNDGLLLKSELDQVAKDYPARVKAFYTVSHLIEGSTTRQGHIDKEFLETILPHRDQENHVFLSSLLLDLSNNPSAAILDGLRGLERKTSLVFTLLKASVYSIVLNQQIDTEGGSNAGDDNTELRD